MSNSRDMNRERRTVAAMLRLFCRDHHATRDALCDDCEDLLAYAMRRLDRCVYGTDKPICSKCPVHCYRPAHREQICEVMRYAGPRMLLRHPALAVGHMLDRRKPVPARKTKQ